MRSEQQEVARPPGANPYGICATGSPKPQPGGMSGGIRCRIEQQGMAIIKHLLHVRPSMHFSDEDTGPEKVSGMPWVEQPGRRDVRI